MRFYTYYYLLSRIEVTNWLQIFFIVLATSILLFSVFKYYKEKTKQVQGADPDCFVFGVNIDRKSSFSFDYRRDYPIIGIGQYRQDGRMANGKTEGTRYGEYFGYFSF